MRKLLLAFFSLPLLTFGQGLETFDNASTLPSTGTSYVDGSFTGEGGIVWSFVHSRNADGNTPYPIDGNGILLRRPNEPSSISATIPGGIGNISVDTRKAFTGAGARHLELVINGVAQTPVFSPSYGSGTQSGVIVYSVSNINVAGNVNIEFRLVNGSSQMTLDNISWTGFTAPATNCGITTADLTAITCNNAGTPGNVTDDFVTFSLNPTGSYLGGNGYTVSVPTGTITPATGVYGTATTFTLQGGSAGAGDVVVTLTDADSTSCSLNVTVTDPGVCSSSTPLITVAPASLTTFDHYVGTPSASQSFTVAGSNLDEDITLTASTDVEISEDDITFVNSLVLPHVAGDVVTTTLYVRSIANVAGAFTGNVVATSLNATNDTLIISGTANLYIPSITVTPATLTSFDHYVGTPSASQSFTVSGNVLDEDITLTASTDVEISEDDITFVNSLVLPHVSGTVVTTTLYVRSIANVAGAFTGNVVATSLNATNDTLMISGTASLYIPVITVTPASLTAFDHYVGTPSTSQTFTVAGSALDEDITLTASTGVEISSDNTTFSSSIVVPHVSNTVATTTLYVRANAATAGAFTGNVVATSLNATNDTLMISGTASVLVPVITVTPASLTAFNHFVGTPSASQTFTVAGNELSADITLTASTGVEISSDNTTFSTSITLPQTANTVATTTIHVRGNSAVYGAFTGNVIATSTGADNDTLVISGFANDYVPYTIDQINGVNANGVGDSVNVFVRLHGVVHCMDFRANAGYNFIIIDETGEGLYVFSSTDVNGYTTPMAGDSLEIKGKIDQFNGLLQVVPAQITVLEQGVATIDPVVVTTLDEASESQYITLENVTFVTPIATFPTTNTNIDVTNGTNTFQIRILTSTDLAGAPAPQGTFNVTGIGSQFDSSNPFTSGYQLLPCGTSAFEVVCTGSNLPNVATTTSGKTITATATGMTYQWINCTTDTPISGATSRTYTATTPGSYAVIVSNANCSDTSACVVLDDASIEGVDFGKTIVAYPNPVNDQLTIQNFNSNTVIFNVTDINGKVITENVTLTSVSVINTSSWNKGIYFVNFTGVNKEAHTLRIVK